MIVSGGSVVGMGLIGYFRLHIRAQQQLFLQGDRGDVETGETHGLMSRDYRTMRSDIDGVVTYGIRSISTLRL
jgi:hypothetical protein